MIRLFLLPRAFYPYLMLIFFFSSQMLHSQFINQGLIFDPRTIYGQWAGVLQCTVGDYNNDGSDDFYVTIIAIYGGPYSGRLFENDGFGNFVDVTNSSQLITIDHAKNAIWGDYNQDGYLDLLVINENISNLFKNLGNGTFIDVGPQVGISGLTCSRFIAPSILWFDYNRDGYPDILFHRSSSFRTFRNQGGEHFVEITQEIALDQFNRHGSISLVDYDNDGDLDISIEGSILEQKSNGTFEEISIAQSYGESAWGDLDNDGLLDYFAGNALLKNLGNGTFSNISSHIEFNNCTLVDWIDYDNDGFLDNFQLIDYTDVWPIFILSRNLGDTYFQNISSTSGLSLQPSDGAVWSDVDLDGDIDLLFGSLWIGYGVEYFENTHSGNSLIIQLQGTASGTDALGARAYLYGTTSDSTILMQRYIYGVKSASNQNSQKLHFGLQNVTQIDSLVIYWPSGIRQVVFAPNNFSTITEARYDHDLFVQFFKSPLQIDSSTIFPEVMIRNIGTNDETQFTVKCLIEKNGIPVYSDSQVVNSLLPDSTTTLQFSGWEPEEGQLELIGIVQSDIDENSRNDTLFLNIDYNIVSIATSDLNSVPNEYFLYQNFPNPFNPDTFLKYELFKTLEVRLRIFNILGEEIIELLNTKQAPGVYTVHWDGRDQRGIEVSSGIYFYYFVVGKNARVGKIVLNR